MEVKWALLLDTQAPWPLAAVGARAGAGLLGAPGVHRASVARGLGAGAGAGAGWPANPGIMA
jgi:hypothetical protein